jgi:hypothetical protein
MPAQLGLPSIDQNICNTWTVDDVDYYNKLPFYFVKATGAWQKTWETWSKLLGSIPWTPNVGDTMREVGIEPTPVLRQQAFPTLLKATPTADVTHVKERTTDAQLYRHRFITPHFNFLPAFQDFIGNKVAPSRENLNRQISIYTESFYRTHMFHYAPYVYVCGTGLMAAHSAMGSQDGSTGKSNAWLAANVLNLDIVPLSFKELYAAMNDFEQICGATPFEGTQMPAGTSEPLNDKYVIVGQSEVWNSFIDDPWVKENRPLNLNILTQGFYGDIFGRARFRHEKYGLRIKVDNRDYSPSYPAPETIDLSPTSANYLRTMPNEDYAKNSEIGVAWLVGGPNYKIIEVGPPPSAFSATDVNGLVGMDWNGKIQMTKNFLVPCLDSDGNVQMDTNSWGEFLRLQAQCVMGIVGFNKFNILPIFYRRKIRISTLTT